MERTILHNLKLIHPDENRVEENAVVLFNHANPVFPPDLIGYSGQPDGEGAPSLTDPLPEDAVLDNEGLYMTAGYFDLDLKIVDETIEDEDERTLVAYRHAGNALNRGMMACVVKSGREAAAVKKIGDRYLLWTPEMILMDALPVDNSYEIFCGAPADGTKDKDEYLEKVRNAVKAGKKPLVATGMFPEEMVNEMQPVIRAAALLHEGGYSQMEAIAAITVNPAQYLGIADRIGALHTGMEGNTVAVAGYPLTDFKALMDIRMFARGGRLIRSQLSALNRIRFALVPPGCEE